MVLNSEPPHGSRGMLGSTKSPASIFQRVLYAESVAQLRYEFDKCYLSCFGRDLSQRQQGREQPAGAAWQGEARRNEDLFRPIIF